MSAWLGRIALIATLVVVLIIQHGYIGLKHDSQIYTLPAVAHLQPELLGNDIMLRFGSQDRFTIFSPLYATAIRALGVENAAATLTLLWQIAFFVAAAALARKLMPARLVWVGLALLCAFPGYYGARSIFAVVEDFASPRLITEALVLGGLTAFLSRRFWIAGGLALLAALLHPLMAAAGMAVALFMSPTPPRARAWIIAGAAAAGLALFGVLAAQGTQIRFDDAWLRLLQRGTDYLFLEQWTIRTWARTAVMLATLLVGALVLEKSPARSLCIAVGIAAVIGTAVSYVGGDLLRLVLIVQVQLWRWNWIVNVVAALLLPLIVVRAWSQGPLWRSAILLLVSAWLCAAEIYALEILALLIPLVIVASRKNVVVPERVGRQIFVGACVLTGLAVLYHVATGILFANAVPDESDVPALVKSIRALARTGALPFAFFVAMFLLIDRMKALPIRATAAAIGIAMLALLAPVATHEWTKRAYGPDTFHAFESWRAQIPVGSEVLWFDSPLASWLLLQRPSYLSNQQESQGLFSRPAAMAMKSRVDALGPFLDSEAAVGWTERRALTNPGEAPRVTLAELCAATDVRYVVTQKDLAATPIATTPPDAPAVYKGAQLYGCPDSQG